MRCRAMEARALVARLNTDPPAPAGDTPCSSCAYWQGQHNALRQECDRQDERATAAEAALAAKEQLCGALLAAWKGAAKAYQRMLKQQSSERSEALAAKEREVERLTESNAFGQSIWDAAMEEVKRHVAAVEADRNRLAADNARLQAIERGHAQLSAVMSVLQQRADEMFGWFEPREPLLRQIERGRDMLEADNARLAGERDARAMQLHRLALQFPHTWERDQVLRLIELWLAERGPATPQPAEGEDNG